MWIFTTVLKCKQQRISWYTLMSKMFDIKTIQKNQHVNEKRALVKVKDEKHDKRSGNFSNTHLMNGQIAHCLGSWALCKKHLKCQHHHTFLNNKLTFCVNWLIDLINIENVFVLKDSIFQKIKWRVLSYENVTPLSCNTSVNNMFMVGSGAIFYHIK